MKSKLILALVTLFVASACNLGQVTTSPAQESSTEAQPAVSDQESAQTSPEDQGSSAAEQPPTVTQPGQRLVTDVTSPSIGDIAVQVTLPQEPRYEDGAGVLIVINTFLTSRNDFDKDLLDVTSFGLIHVTYLWPGVESKTGAQSDGTFDYGGPQSIQVLRDVIRFASGQIPNSDGYYLEDLIAIQPLSDNVGLYAFSHPGIAAVNVLALYGDQLQVGYLVGRENPTLDTLTAVEAGHFDNQGRPQLNPLYSYPSSYSTTKILIDYSTIEWGADYTEAGSSWVGAPYFDLNGNQSIDGADFVLGTRVPSAYGKRLYSVDLISALTAKGAIGAGDWPSDLATLEEVTEIWTFLDSTQRYPTLASTTPDLKVMLVFARFDHVQPAADKPHIHQAYDGFSTTAGLWARLNPDESYVSSINPGLGNGYIERPANTQPTDWLEAEKWGYANQPGSAQIVAFAAIAEMADRLHEGDWSDDLGQVLVAGPSP